MDSVGQMILEGNKILFYSIDSNLKKYVQSNNYT